MDISIFAALAEPKRLQIVELLREEALPVGEIAERIGMRQPQTSKHLRILSEAGLVKVNAVANRRYYKLQPEPFLELEQWLEAYRHEWEDRFDRLDEYLLEMKNEK